MTQLSFTSGELMDIIVMLEDKIVSFEFDEDYYTAAYYGNIQQQFETVLAKVKEMQPENRVAFLVMTL
jgi:hypothetical protein